MWMYCHDGPLAGTAVGQVTPNPDPAFLPVMMWFAQKNIGLESEVIHEYRRGLGPARVAERNPRAIYYHFQKSVDGQPSPPEEAP